MEQDPRSADIFVVPAAARGHGRCWSWSVGAQQRAPGRRICRRPRRPGRRASSTSSSRSPSAASWTRASCASPGTRWSSWPRATRSRCSSARRSASCSGCRSCSPRASTRSSRCCGRSRRWPGCRWAWCCSRSSEPAALFTIAICSMWPTVLNTAMGVRAIPQDYLNVAKVLKLSPTKTLLQDPASRPRCPTCSPASASASGIAWLVIVAVEMLTGTPGVGGFLWQEYNSLIYAHIILCILTIGLVGFVLDRLMSAGRAPLHGRPEPWPSSSSQSVAQGLRHGRRARARCCANVNLAVEHGEFVAIVGYSGAGKTTLISLIAGLIAPDTGTHHARRARRSPSPGPTAASCSRTTRCCPG